MSDDDGISGKMGKFGLGGRDKDKKKGHSSKEKKKSKSKGEDSEGMCNDFTTFRTLTAFRYMKSNLPEHILYYYLC
jgi:hypothetical protein